MSTQKFIFQQFTINQSKTAMKAGTDGVLLGACCDFSKAENILDIGTGTGLITLMAAQKSNAKITAIEIDEDAFEQAKENFEVSKFKDRIKILHDDFLIFAEHHNQKFDYIVSNPPFFQNSKKSDNSQRNLARHTDSLPFKKMIFGVNNLLDYNGTFSVIIPYNEILDFTYWCAKCGMHICRKIVIYTKPNTTPLRAILSYSKTIRPLIQNDLIINDQNGKYSQDFRTITKDFYLHLK